MAADRAHRVDESPRRPPSPRTVLAIVTAGGVAGACLIALAYTSPEVAQPGLSAVLSCWVVLPYILAGLIAWHRRPESSLGALMVTAGFVTFLSFLNWSGNDLLYTLGVAAQFLPPVLFLHVFLAFPSGRLESRPDRAVVAAAYGAAALTVPVLILGADDPRDVLAAADAPTAANVLHTMQLLLVSTLSVGGIALLIRRRRRAGRPLRASAGLLVDSFSLGLLMIAGLLLAGLFGWTGVQGPLRLATFAVIGTAPIVFLAVLLQARLGRASAAQLLVDLGVNPGPVELQDAVARAIRDPSARLLYRVAEYDSYADVDGQQMDLRHEPSRSVTPITRDGRPVAMLLHDCGLDDDPRLLSSVAAATGMAIQNAHLHVELRARLEELRGSRMRILQAEQRERRRLERNLHDGAQHRLVALSLELGKLGYELSQDPLMRARVDAANTQVAAALAELRDLAHGIHPVAVSDHGLGVALESLATHSTVPVQVVGAPIARLPEPVELAAFYLVSESLANIGKHARASSAIVELKREDERLVVEVTDDGRGGATTERGTGLRGLADRVEALGGRLQVWSPAGEGTRVRAEIPCRQ
jgi:signal transduction histidine kinase